MCWRYWIKWERVDGPGVMLAEHRWIEWLPCNSAAEGW